MAFLSAPVSRSQAVRLAVLFAAALLSGSGVAVAEAGPAPAVSWTDTEGDVVSLREEGSGISLFANGERVFANVYSLQVTGDGTGLTFSTEDDKSAYTVVRDLSVTQEVQEFLRSRGARKGPPPAAARADTATATVPVIPVEAAGEIIAPPREDQQAQEDIRSHYHVLHLGHQVFSQTVLRPPSGHFVEHWIVMFCYSWYEPCQKIAEPYSVWSGEWEAKLNQDLFTKRVRFAKVDCATDKELCNAQGVDGYPYVKHYSEGGAVAKWTGGRDNDGTRLVKWLNKQVGDGEKKSKKEKDQPVDVQESPEQLRKRGIDALLVLGVLAVTFRAVCLNADLWKGPAAATVAAPQAPPAPPAPPRAAEPRRLPAEWARPGSMEL